MMASCCAHIWILNIMYCMNWSQDHVVLAFVEWYLSGSACSLQNWGPSGKKRLSEYSSWHKAESHFWSSLRCLWWDHKHCLKAVCSGPFLVSAYNESSRLLCKNQNQWLWSRTESGTSAQIYLPLIRRVGLNRGLTGLCLSVSIKSTVRV